MTRKEEISSAEIEKKTPPIREIGVGCFPSWKGTCYLLLGIPSEFATEYHTGVCMIINHYHMCKRTYDTSKFKNGFGMPKKGKFVALLACTDSV